MTDNAIYEVKDKAKKFERWVRNTISGASEIEVKVKEATCNDKWGPTGKQMQDIAGASHSFEHFDLIMKTLWMRLNDNGKYWRHVYKGLLLLEYLLKNGSEQVVRACQSNSRLIQTLTKFQFVTEKGKDEGENVRNRARQIVELLGDDSRIREERKKAAETRRRFDQSMSSDGFNSTSQGDYGNYSRGNYGNNDRNERGGDRGERRTERNSESGDKGGRNKYDDEEDGVYSSSEEDIKPPQRTNNTSNNTSQGEKKPRPPSTEINKKDVPQQKPQQSLIELFDTPSTTTNTNPNFIGFQNNLNPQSFQQQSNSGFGGYQGTTTNNQSGFGGFQGGNNNNNTGFGGFQGTTTTNNQSGFGGFQSGGGGLSPRSNNIGFGGFQSGNNDEFDSFNPRGGSGGNTPNNNSSGGMFANFENPNQNKQEEEKKGIWGETSSLVNLQNLVENPNTSTNSSQEKKTLGQSLQNKQTQKPVMSGGITPNPLNPINPLNTQGSFGVQQQQPLVNLQIQNLSLQQIQQLTPIQIQQLNPQQLQQLQYQYQLQLQLQQQQQQQFGGNRGF